MGMFNVTRKDLAAIIEEQLEKVLAIQTVPTVVQPEPVQPKRTKKVQVPSKKLIGQTVLDAFRTTCMFKGKELPSWPKVGTVLELSQGVRTKKQVKNTIFKLVSAGYLIPNRKSELIHKDINIQRDAKYVIAGEALERHKATWLKKYSYYSN
jgi:hypothetical protein